MNSTPNTSPDRAMERRRAVQAALHRAEAPTHTESPPACPVDGDPPPSGPVALPQGSALPDVLQQCTARCYAAMVALEPSGTNIIYLLNILQHIREHVATGQKSSELVPSWCQH